MEKVTSVSGGRTSAYTAMNFPTDHNVFALVRTEDKKCLYPDKKLRQIVEDRIQLPFIGTLEDDIIIHTILDLEQLLGKEITWVSGITFDEVISKKGGWLPNKLHRYCTTWLKIVPIFHWWYLNFDEPIEMQLGYRASEVRRKLKSNSKLNDNGLLEIKATVEKHKNGNNKWQIFEWQKPIFPLIDSVPTFNDSIIEFWKDKQIRFAELNNCVGCFHRNPMLLRKMWDVHPTKMDWFNNAEIEKSKTNKGTWRSDISYNKIKNHKIQVEIDFSDFGDCDSGFCEPS